LREGVLCILGNGNVQRISEEPLPCPENPFFSLATVGGFLFFGRSNMVEQLAEPQTAKVFSGI
jgi:hypothetical protein